MRTTRASLILAVSAGCVWDDDNQPSEEAAESRSAESTQLPEAATTPAAAQPTPAADVQAPARTLAQATENLIRNPGFEAGLSEWHSTRDINPADSATFDVTDGRSISGAMSAVGVDSQPGNLGRLYQDVTDRMIAGRTYEIGGWTRTEGVEGQVVIGLDYVNSDGWTPGGESYVWELGHVTGTRDWTYFESDPFVLPAAPPRAGATALWFLFDFNNGAGTAWWDDVFLREASRPAPAAACLNGGSASSARLALATGQPAFAANRANLRENHGLLATRERASASNSSAARETRAILSRISNRSLALTALPCLSLTVKLSSSLGYAPRGGGCRRAEGAGR